MQATVFSSTFSREAKGEMERGEEKNGGLDVRLIKIPPCNGV